ncbi:MAG: hypothetical protein AAFY33_05945 [Cyanobacteria bacterium J06643_4]
MIKFFRLPAFDFLARGEITPPIQELLLTRTFRTCLLATFAIGVSLGAGINQGFNRAATISGLTDVTRAEYERIELQMPRAEVEAILGRGIEVEQSALSTTFEWKNPDGSSMTATFRKGNVIRKSQSDL